MQREVTQKGLSDRLQELQQRLHNLQNLLHERKNRLDYFINEGVSDMICRRALTSVQETKEEMDRIRMEMEDIRQDLDNLGDCGLN